MKDSNLLDKKLNELFEIDDWEGRQRLYFSDLDDMEDSLIKKKEEFKALNEKMFEKAHWISRKDYYILSELMGDFKQGKRRRSWEVVIEYSDGRIIGYHYANGNLGNYILDILKDGILCERGSNEFKNFILSYKNNPSAFVQDAYYFKVINQISRYIRMISVQVTVLTFRGHSAFDILSNSHFLYNYDSPFWLSTEHKCLPSSVEEFVGIPKTERFGFGELISRIEEIRYQEFENKYQLNTVNDDPDFYDREAFYYLTGGQAGDYEDHYPREASTDDY